MAQISPEPERDSNPPVVADRLNSWKEIAAFLGTTERTVQRWEKTESLPVHRHLHSKRGTVYAFRQELDTWRRGRSTQSGSRPVYAGRQRLWAAGAVFVLGFIAIVAWRLSVRRSEAPPDSIKFTSLPGRERHPRFSPDGKVVAFSWSGQDNQNADIYTKRVGGDDIVRLTAHPAPETNPVWSPDGQRVAFLRAVDRDKRQVVSIPINAGPSGQDSEQVLAEVNVPWEDQWFYDSYLAWSPDGQYLAIAERRASVEPIALSLLVVNSREKRTLTSPSAKSIGDLGPAFSPDGKTLAFTRMSSSFLSEVYVVPVDSNVTVVPRQITSEKSWVIGPVWSADGRRIVYSSGDQANRSLFSITLDSSRLPVRR